MKKFIRPFAIIGAAAAIALTASTGVRAVEYPKGDLNCSGAVTSLDMVLMNHIAAGGANPFECGQSADLDCSGMVTSRDISIMTYIAAGGTYVC